MKDVKVDFEKSFKELENITNKLSNDSNITLDDALKLYEKGLNITSELKLVLDQARKKVEDLNKKHNKGNE